MTEARAQALAEVRRAQAAELRARQAHEARQRATRLAVAKALAADVPAPELATMLDVSRQRVYQMRDEALTPKAA